MFARSVFRGCISTFRQYSVSSNNASDLRARFMTEIKTAMKNKDRVTSTTLRSVLSEINAAEKSVEDGLSSSATTSLIRKAVQRRTEAAVKFHEANRADLAAKEEREAALLSSFLPPLLSAADIDSHLKPILSVLPNGTDPRKALGFALKEFYSNVDKSTVDPNLVKQRTQDLIDSDLPL